MIQDFAGKTAVLTGAGSGFGLECARIGARLGMSLVLADVQQDALDKAVAEMEAAGAQVLGMRVDVSQAAQVEALGATTLQAYSDNSILVEQLDGRPAKPVARLAGLFDQARALLRGFDQFSLHWIPRHRNGEADALARAALAEPPQRTA